ncbi:MAG: glycosyltransferase family 2 protein, partial [Odoribacter sp.]|nr:glycosyltransferase family 2 protein [Odoribacter sp.]
RMLQAARMADAVMLYADYVRTAGGVGKNIPVLEYQPGSLRDDFDFGPLQLYRTREFTEAVNEMDENYRYAALYDLRLRLSRKGVFLHLPESLYAVAETDFRKSGEKQFDYVNPRNREVQVEMEKVCTAHLRTIGAWLVPRSRNIDVESGHFPVEATVVIPVKNRVNTIADAVGSALCQQTDFPFNVIVVDNHSTDGTTAVLQELARKNPLLVHPVPASRELGIGGCWNEAVRHPQCGRFAIQLDSDDLYRDEHTLRTIVEAFYREKCAMVIGSYRMVNFNLEEIPPGVIDHREWTAGNGHNNALRINGLGAPRAFYTPVVRKIGFPDVSYGEDYAVALAVSREYRIGRIFEPLYLCRRWEGNSDAALDIVKQNAYHFYKDKIRTLELKVRMRMNIPEIQHG